MQTAFIVALMQATLAGPCVVDGAQFLERLEQRWTVRTSCSHSSEDVVITHRLPRSSGHIDNEVLCNPHLAGQQGYTRFACSHFEISSCTGKPLIWRVCASVASACVINWTLHSRTYVHVAFSPCFNAVSLESSYFRKMSLFLFHAFVALTLVVSPEVQE